MILSLESGLVYIGLPIRAINADSLQSAQHFLDCVKTCYLLLDRHNTLKIDPYWLKGLFQPPKSPSQNLRILTECILHIMKIHAEPSSHV